MGNRNFGEKEKIITKLVKDGKLGEAFKELRKLPKPEVEKIWKSIVKEPAMPLEKEKIIYEIIKQLRAGSGSGLAHSGSREEGR